MRKPSYMKSKKESDFKLMVLADGVKASRKRIGPTTKINYGYRTDGAMFYVHKSDLNQWPGQMFRKPTDDELKAAGVKVKEDAAPVEEPAEEKPKRKRRKVSLKAKEDDPDSADDPGSDDS